MLAVFARSQDSEIPDVDELIANGEDGMLISPAPAMAEEGSDENSMGEDIAALVVEGGDDIQEGLDWIMDLYNTFCSDEDGDGEIDPMDVDALMEAAGMMQDENGEWVSSDDTAMSLDGLNMAMEGAEDWEMDEDSMEVMDDLTDTYNQICMTIKGFHNELSDWNSADSAGKQSIEENWSEEIQNFVESFMEGAISNYALAGTALVAGVAALSF